MLDDKDVEKLIKAQKEVFVTKEEFEGLIDIVVTKDEVNNLGNRLDGRMGKIENVLEKMDKKLDEVVQTSKEVEYIRNTLGIPALKKI